MASEKKKTPAKKTSSSSKKKKTAKKPAKKPVKKPAKKKSAKKPAKKSAKKSKAKKSKVAKKTAKKTKAKKAKKATVKIKGTRHEPSVFLLVHIALSLSPLERLERFEEPIDLALGSLGAVSGGGSSLDEDGGVTSCDIEIEIHDVARSLPILRRVLTEGAAPKGTLITRLAPDGAFEVLDEL